jgi:hypothetical protein
VVNSSSISLVGPLRSCVPAVRCVWPVRRWTAAARGRPYLPARLLQRLENQARGRHPPGLPCPGSVPASARSSRRPLPPAGGDERTNRRRSPPGAVPPRVAPSAPTTGRVTYHGKDMFRLSRAYRRDVHPVFQNPHSTFNPFYRIDRVFWKTIRKSHLAHSTAAGEQMTEEPPCRRTPATQAHPRPLLSDGQQLAVGGCGVRGAAGLLRLHPVGGGAARAGHVPHGLRYWFARVAGCRVRCGRADLLPLLCADRVPAAGVVAGGGEVVVAEVHGLSPGMSWRVGWMLLVGDVVYLAGHRPGCVDGR